MKVEELLLKLVVVATTDADVEVAYVTDELVYDCDVDEGIGLEEREDAVDTLLISTVDELS